MKSRRHVRARGGWFGLVLACGLAGAGVRTQAREGGPPVPKPSKEHAVLKKEVGTWDASIKAWEEPGKDPSVSKGTETNRMLAGGLWLDSVFKSDFAGTVFEGRGQYGYDARKKKYVGTWVDSMSSALMTLEGAYDAASHTLTMVGDSTDPAGEPYTMRIASTYKDDGSRVSTMFVKSKETGQEFFKMMEITYTKRPSAAK